MLTYLYGCVKAVHIDMEYLSLALTSAHVNSLFKICNFTKTDSHFLKYALECSHSMATYSIIIPAYNEEAFLPATLEAARSVMDELKTEFGRGELIVVDNDSTDRTVEVAREHGADRIVHEPHRQIARARNTGARASGADWIVFLDADTRLTTNVLYRALSALRSGRVAGGGAPVVMDGEITRVVAGIVWLWNHTAAVLRNAAGSFFFVRRDAFVAVGGFDEAVYASEEVWLSRQLRAWAREHGMDFVILPHPIVTSSRKSDWFSTRAFIAQMALFTICPWATRSRRLCRIWYRRPVESV